MFFRARVRRSGGRNGGHCSLESLSKTKMWPHLLLSVEPFPRWSKSVKQLHIKVEHCCSHWHSYFVLRVSRET
jgi:hypothetical protein